MKMRQPLRIFLVEDSQTIVDNLSLALVELVGAQVIGVAHTELGALEWIQKNPNTWDLMIVDIFLQKTGNGFRVLKALQGKAKAQKAVVLSNYAMDVVRLEAIALGADAVFDKTSELEELLAFCMELSN